MQGINKIDLHDTFNNTFGYLSLLGGQVERLPTCSCIPALGRGSPLAFDKSLLLLLLWSRRTMVGRSLLSSRRISASARAIADPVILRSTPETLSEKNPAILAFVPRLGAVTTNQCLCSRRCLVGWILAVGV